MFAASKSGSVVDAKDPQFNYVTMLLHGDGTNGAQNNTFLDSSTNNFTITRNGNTTQGTFTPYGSNWSNYFNGSTDYLTTPSSANLAFASGDLTVEVFAYLTGSANARFLFDFRTSGSESTTRIYSYVSGTTLYIGFGGSDDINVGSVFTASQQNHLAIVRSGSGSNNVSIFLNGSRIYQLTDTTNFSTNTLATIGRRYAIASGDNYWLGYLSNLRALKGTAQYSGTTYTVPTSPLTAITNTQLLTCQSNRFIDNSTNAFTLTVNGSPSVQRFSPFSPTTAYSTSVIGGSGYFDGSGDYLKAPDNAAFSMSTNPFTVECWVYVTTAASAGQSIISQWISGNDSNSSWMLGFNWGGGSGGNKFEGTISIGGSVTSITDTSNYSLNTWYHLVLSRSGSPGTLALFVNGTRVASTSITGSIVDATNSVGIGIRGGGTDYPFPGGYISNVRVVNGTDVYGSTNTTLTIPTAPLTAVTNTSLLLNMTNAGILDNAMMNDLETVGNAQISTSVKKYGTGSLAFDGTGDYLLLQGGQNFTFGTGDFTIEMWIYVVSGLNADIVYYDGRPTSTNGLYNIIYTNTTGKLIYSANSADRITGTTTLSTGTWYHIALSRSGTSTKLFLSGTQEGSTYTDSNSYIVGANRPVIGGNGYTLGNAPLNGYIDDLRITKGVARYTANFTAPTAAFADKG
jgi:hypothetical protein